jgi:hypothetical protein
VIAEGQLVSVRHFHIPGDATKREYAVYVMVATNRSTGRRKLYVGKTGDNRAGCNPVISRAGNHFSFNILHSQMRNWLKPDDPQDFDFDYFYTTFGCYVTPKESRDGINVINEMERQLSLMAQKDLEPYGEVLAPYRAKTKLSKANQINRKALATDARLTLLSQLVREVKEFLKGGTPRSTSRMKPRIKSRAGTR